MLAPQVRRVEGDENMGVGAMNDDRITRLERLAKLRDEGVLSQQEFDAEKARVLDAADQSASPEPTTDAIPAPHSAGTPTLTNTWLIAGIGALVLVVVVLVAVMISGRGGYGPVNAEGRQTQSVAADPTTVAIPEPGVTSATPEPPEPALPAASVATVPPKITDNWRSLRTRIREGWGTEPTFANRYVIIRVGCGTGCTGNIVGDHRTGELYPLGLGGEGYDQLQLRFDNASNLLTARWGEIETQTCVTQRFRWGGTELEEVSPRETVPRVDYGCDELGA